MSEDLYRSLPFELEVRAAAQGGDGRTVEGIAVPYGRAMRIDDSLTEQFAQGAFTHQMSAMHRVRFARGHVAQGGVPVGRIVEARDDAAGLWVAMRVSAIQDGDNLLTLIRDNVYDELSIGFRTRAQGSARLGDGTVERRRADLFEVAAVLEGAYGRHATVTGVRSAEGAPADDGDGPRPGMRAAEVAALRGPDLDSRFVEFLGTIPRVAS